MKHVVSVSLGSSARDTDQVVTLLGEQVHIERRGTQGDLEAARRIIHDIDGKVDAIGLGGIDLFVPVGERRYYFRDARSMAQAARVTPVVCGAGLKDTLERAMIDALDETIGWRGKRVLMVSAIDRFGMAEALAARGASMTFGDVIFVLGLPVAMRSLRALHALGNTLLPTITRMPFRWIYPLGEKQDVRETTERYARYYAAADVLAGDWHYIRRYAPNDLGGKVILTNTTTKADVTFLREHGARTLITTTPRFGERTLGTNLLEAAFVAIDGSGSELSRQRYQAMLAQAKLEPTVLDLQGAA